jgi:hypothetical protein
MGNSSQLKRGDIIKYVREGNEYIGIIELTTISNLPPYVIWVYPPPDWEWYWIFSDYFKVIGHCDLDEEEPPCPQNK